MSNSTAELAFHRTMAHDPRAPSTHVAATCATLLAAAVIVPLMAYCLWRHPFGCLLAIVIAVLPLFALFHRSFRRNPVVPAAIACCLCLLCSQILDQFHTARVAAREERFAEVTMLTDKTPNIAAAPIDGGASDTAAPSQPARKRFGRGAFRRMLRARKQRRSAAGGFQRQPGIDASNDTVKLLRGLSEQVKGSDQGLGEENE